MEELTKQPAENQETTVENVQDATEISTESTPVEVTEIIETEKVEVVENTITEEPAENGTPVIENTVTKQEVVEETPVVEEVHHDHEFDTSADEQVLKTLAEIEETSTIESEIVNEHEDVDEIEEVELNEEAFKNHTPEGLVDLLEKLVEEADVNEIKTKVSLIKVAFLSYLKEEKHKHFEEFIAQGGNKEEYQIPVTPLEERFNAAFGIYRDKRTRFTEELEREKQENLTKKTHILEELRKLIDSEETLKKTYDEFRTLQEEWKTIGQVPRNDVNNLWQTYHFLVEKFFDKVKINKELRDLDLKKNLERKVELCEKVEELLIESSITKSFKLLQQYHEEWKEIGPVPQDKKDEIWDRFRTATEKINSRRREYYDEMNKDQQSNLLAKSALCEKAEELLVKDFKSVKSWQDATNEINELLKTWKAIGRAPQKANDEVWERFKNGLDTFFTNKKEYFDKLKEEQLNNYNLKVELCVQAEAIAQRNDWKRATNELLDLQQQWRKIGPAPRKYSDKIWLRFRAACDEFFSKKASFFSSIKGEESTNQQKKEELIAKVKEYAFGEDRNENLKVIKDLQREWMEIGHVPFKEKDRIQNEFRTAINEQLDKLKINYYEVSGSGGLRHKIDQISSAEDADKLSFKEKNMLVTRITKLREDIGVWENNIGFLANSKNASILKDEFENKINKAKQELALLEAKLKIIRNS